MSEWPLHQPGLYTHHTVLCRAMPELCMQYAVHSAGGRCGWAIDERFTRSHRMPGLRNAYTAVSQKLENLQPDLKKAIMLG